jgi:hypothetical protein
MRIEAATFEDIRAIAEVHVASWQSAYAGIMMFRRGKEALADVRLIFNLL